MKDEAKRLRCTSNTTAALNDAGMFGKELTPANGCYIGAADNV